MSEAANWAAAAVNHFGGLLRCTVCGREEPRGDLVSHFATGWPKCHGYTMRWITDSELADEKAISGE